MPLFQYACKKCRAESEILVRGSETPSCPKCGSDDLMKQLSVFNAVDGGKRKPVAPCGRPEGCPSGGCGLN